MSDEPRFKVTPNATVFDGKRCLACFYPTDFKYPDALVEAAANAQAYVEWRNNPPTAPKFKVGDRVNLHDGYDPDPCTILEVITEPSYRIDRSIDTWIESRLYIPGPEPKPRWEARQVSSECWNIMHGAVCEARCYTEELARWFCDELNDKQDAEG